MIILFVLFRIWNCKLPVAILIYLYSTFFSYLPRILKLYNHVELAALNMLHQTRPCVESIKNSHAFGSPAVLRPWATHTSHTLCRLPSSSASKSSRSYSSSCGSLRTTGWITLPCLDCSRFFAVLLSTPMFCTAALCNIVNSVSQYEHCVCLSVCLSICAPLLSSVRRSAALSFCYKWTLQSIDRTLFRKDKATCYIWPNCKNTKGGCILQPCFRFQISTFTS